MSRGDLKQLTQLLVTVALLLVSGAARATVYSFTTADTQGSIASTLHSLAAGDEVVFAAGTYTFTVQLSITAAGTLASPVLVHAAPGAAVVFVRDDMNHDGLYIDGSTYLTLSGIELEPSANAPGAIGLRVRQASSNVTISDCNIHGFVSGITANSPSDTTTNLIIRHNELHDFGAGTQEGLYAGCADASCTATGIIENNWFHDSSRLTPPTGGSLGTGVLIKKGSSFTVRDNVFSDTNSACVFAYGGGTSPNVIERNACIRVASDSGFEVAGDATIRNNVIVGPADQGIFVTSNSGLGVPTDNVIVQNNTIVASFGGIGAPGIVGTVGIYDNAIYASTNNAISVAGTLTNLTVSGNLGVGTTSGITSGFSATGNLTNDFVDVAYDASSLNAYPKSGSALIGAADGTHIAADDFNAYTRGALVDIGAYAYFATGNPGQTIAAGFKTLPAPPDMDAGVDSGTDAGSDASTADDGGAIADGGSSSDAGKNDGGSSSSDASLGGDSGGASTSRDDAGSSNNGAASSDDSGCGCRVGPDSDSNGYAFSLISLGLVALTGARRSRRRRSRS